MHVAVARLTLRLPESSSLKDKRMVVRSVLQRVRNRFNAAAAEVDTQDTWRIATLGFVCISNDARHANEMVSKIVEFVANERLDAEVDDSEIEVIPL